MPSVAALIGLLVGFVLIWVAFALWEVFQGERAMLVPRIIRQRSILVSPIFQSFYASGYYVLLYYLPIYFQSVDNTSPIQSGVRNLPMALALSVGSALSGGFVSRTGHAVPIMLGGAILTTISAGLTYTFDIGTPSEKWIGY